MSKYARYIDHIDPEKLPFDYQELIEIVGLEKTLEIAERVGGTYIYMEKIENVLLPAKRAYILRQCSASSDEQINVRRLARDTDLCMETVYDILRRRHAKDADKSGWKQEVLIPP